MKPETIFRLKQAALFVAVILLLLTIYYFSGGSFDPGAMEDPRR